MYYLHVQSLHKVSSQGLNSYTIKYTTKMEKLVDIRQKNGIFIHGEG